MKKTVNMESFPRLILTLFAVTLICSALLSIVNAVTKDKIEAVAIEAQTAAMRSVLPSAASFDDVSSGLTEDLITNNKGSAVYKAIDSAGSPAGYAVTVSPRGFGGAITMIVGIGTDGTVTGVIITDMSETAGLGARAGDQKFLSQFVGKSGSLSVTKGTAGGNQIAAITGATITSKAVTVGVLAALKAVSAVS